MVGGDVLPRMLGCLQARTGKLGKNGTQLHTDNLPLLRWFRGCQSNVPHKAPGSLIKKGINLVTGT